MRSRLATTTPVMVTGFEVYPIPTREEPVEIETFAVRARRGLHLLARWLAAPGRWFGELVIRHLGTPRGEGGATL